MSGMLCCAYSLSMDRFKKSDYKMSSSRGSQEDGSCETPGRKNSPQASPGGLQAKKKPDAMSGSGGAPKKTISSLQELKEHHAALRQFDKSTQSGETSSARM